MRTRRPTLKNRRIDPRSIMSEAVSSKEYASEANDTMLTAKWLEAMKLPKAVKSQVYEEATSVGRDRPIMLDFRNAFPQFPVYVSVATKTNIRDTISVSKLFSAKNLSKHKFLLNFIEDRDTYYHEIGGRAVIQLLTWPNAGVYVLHDLPANKRDKAAVYTTFVIETDEADRDIHRVQLEPLSQIRQYLADLGVDSEDYES